MTFRLLHHGLDAHAVSTPGAELLITHAPSAARLGYGDVARASNRMARTLVRLGVRPGDRVLVLAANGAEYVAAFFGASKAGAVVVPVNTATDPKSLAFVVRDSGAAVLVVGPRMEKLVVRALADAPRPPTLIVDGAAVGIVAKELPHAVVVPADDVARESDDAFEVRRIDADLAAIVYTSGSTGAPRGAMLSHLALVTNATSIVEYLGLTAADRTLVVLPFFYVYGQSLLTTATIVGASLVVENRFQYVNVALDTLENEKCTGLAGVPSTFAILLDRSNFASRAHEHLRWVSQAGGGMSPTLTRRLMEALPGIRIHVMYGATEASARLAHVPPDELATCVGAIGRAIPNVELTVRRADGSVTDDDEPGELFARGSNLMLGYWNAPDETARVLGPFGYATGDLVTRDARGILRVVGRKTEMLKVGGHRVSAKEVEEAVAEHPAVSEVAVVGIEDPILGHALRAFVVRREGHDVDANGLGAFLQGRLAAYKVPGTLSFVDALPKNASGKITKADLVATAR